MQPGQMAYDRAITVFSPDGRLFQVEYARVAVTRGNTTAGLKFKNGIVLMADKKIGSRLVETSSIEKIFWSEFDKRFRETAIDLLGPGGMLLRSSPDARHDVDWIREFLWSRAGTIYSGSSEIQRNIIAKRVLSLPQM